MVDLFFTIEILISILNPCHDLIVGSHIGAKYVALWSNESFFGKFHSILTSNPLNFSLRIFFWIKPDTTLSSSKWHISDEEFEGHQGSEGHSLLQVNVFGVSGSTLNRQVMVLMLCSVAQESLDHSIVKLDRDFKSEDFITSHNIFEPVLGDGGFSSGLIDVKLDVFEEGEVLLLFFYNLSLFERHSLIIKPLLNL